MAKKTPRDTPVPGPKPSKASSETREAEKGKSDKSSTQVSDSRSVKQAVDSQHAALPGHGPKSKGSIG